MNSLDFSRRKVQRERTLLANINDIKVSKIINVNGTKLRGQPDKSNSPAHVKVWEKNPQGKKHMSTARQQAQKNGLGEEKEEHPAANRQEAEFMQMGGKGDMQLFADDVDSRYLPQEVPD